MRLPGHLRALLRTSLVAGCVLAFLAPLPGYYHFLHLRLNDGALRAFPERFDLRVLPDSAVPFVVSKSIEPEFADGDTWEALLSQVRLGASQWSTVPNSALRLRFAGEVSPEITTPTPHLEVMFQELPPGVIAMGGPVSRDAVASDASGNFVPIKRSVVVMSHRLRERATHSEAFYLTLVHEMGHALGLQHTFTSSVMSTGVTRATTKANPLGPDDHAGIASLYPDKYFGADSGVIRGRVTTDGEALHFAAVTALQASGVAVSAITLPDGSYEIRGLPPGAFYVYAQAIPPSSQEGLGPGQIVLPVDEDGESVPAGPLFSTRFYPAAANWHDAHIVQSGPGTAIDAIDLDVPRVGSRAFQAITTYSFPGSFAVNPAVINANSERRFFVAFGPNTVADGKKLGGLQVESTGAGISEEDVRAYEPAPDFLRVDINLHPFAPMGPKPLLWSRDGEVYVQPVGFLLVGGDPPGVGEVEAAAGENGNFLARVRGTELGAAYSFLFDGQRGDRLPETDATRNEEATLRIPYTADGRPVSVTALGRDGQSSLFLNANPPRVESRVAAPPPLRASRNGVPAGAEALLRFEADGAPFADGAIGLHFDSPDLVVRRVWRESENVLAANVLAMPGASARSLPVVLRRDLALLRNIGTLDILPTENDLVQIDSALIDENTGDAAIYPGSSAIVQASGRDLGDSLPMALGGRALVASRIGTGQYRLQVPEDVPLGFTTLRAELPGRESLPVGVEIVSVPPRIVEASISGVRGEQAGGGTRRVNLVAELPGVDPEQLSTTSITVRANGRPIRSVERTVRENDGSQVELFFDLAAAQLAAGSDSPADVTLRIQWNGRHSAPLTLQAP